MSPYFHRTNDVGTPITRTNNLMLTYGDIDLLRGCYSDCILCDYMYQYFFKKIKNQ